jgi:hypothetical protein
MRWPHYGGGEPRVIKKFLWFPTVCRRPLKNMYDFNYTYEKRWWEFATVKQHYSHFPIPIFTFLNWVNEEWVD